MVLPKCHEIECQPQFRVYWVGVAWPVSFGNWSWKGVLICKSSTHKNQRKPSLKALTWLGANAISCFMIPNLTTCLMTYNVIWRLKCREVRVRGIVLR